MLLLDFFLASSRRHTRCLSDWSSDVCSSDLEECAPRSPSPKPPVTDAIAVLRRTRKKLYLLVRSEERRVEKECTAQRCQRHQTTNADEALPAREICKTSLRHKATIASRVVIE